MTGLSIVALLLLGELFQGVIVDSVGKPVAGATLRRLSGERVETDVAGRFAMTLPLGGGHLLIVEADEYEPMILHNVSAAGEEHPPIVLARGASLAVTSTAATGTLSLLPISAKLPEGLPRDRAIALWSRDLERGRAAWRSLPIGSYSLVALSADAPMEIARVELTAGEKRSLTIEMPGAITAENRNPKKSLPATGSAAIVRVRHATDGRAAEGVRISAVRAADLRTPRADLEKALTFTTGTTNREGWARLEGLGDEELVFMLRAPGRSRPQMSEPWSLRAGEETVIDDLELLPPASLTIRIDVGEELAEWLVLDNVRLQPRDGNVWPMQSAPAASLRQLTAKLDDVPVGSWTVVAEGRMKNDFALRVGAKDIDITAGGHQEVTLKIEDLLYRGVVTRDGDPIGGTLNIQSTDENKSLRPAVATAGDDGTFVAVLQDRGTYDVSIQHKDRSGSIAFDVEFGDPKEIVEVELPSGRISGRIVDDAGEAVPYAGVSATRSGRFGGTGVRADAEGRFLLEGIAPGKWELTATTTSAKSDPMPVELILSSLEGLTLVVAPVRQISMLVVDSLGNPVSDALVVVEHAGELAAGRAPVVRMSRSDGVIDLRLPLRATTTPSNLIVATQDGRITCALRVLDADLALAVPPLTGTVRLLKQRWSIAAGEPRLVAATGCSVGLLGARNERDANGEAMVMNKLAPGSWRYVEIRTAEERSAVLSGRSALLTPIATFELRARDTTTVRTQTGQ